MPPLAGHQPFHSRHPCLCAFNSPLPCRSSTGAAAPPPITLPGKLTLQLHPPKCFKCWREGGARGGDSPRIRRVPTSTCPPEGTASRRRAGESRSLRKREARSLRPGTASGLPRLATWAASPALRLPPPGRGCGQVTVCLPFPSPPKSASFFPFRLTPRARLVNVPFSIGRGAGG